MVLSFLNEGDDKMADQGKPNLIDTEIERSHLEYRPIVKYEPEKPISVNFETEVITPGDIGDDDQSTENLIQLERPAEQFQQFTTLSVATANLITLIENELKDTIIPVKQEDIRRLFDSYPNAPEEIPQEITFELYKESFIDSEVPANSLLQDMVHSYAEDVDGSLELEFYEDLRELQATLEEGYFLFKESIVKNYVDTDIPETPESNEEFTKKMNEAVLKRQEETEETVNKFLEKEHVYYDSLRREYGTPDFFKVSDEYLKAKRPHDVRIREEKTLQEMMNLIDGMLNGTSECIGRIKTGLVLGSDIDGEEVMTVLANQAPSKENLAKLLKMSQLSMKLQVNQQIEEKGQYRDVLKNINNLNRKKRAHDELLTASDLRNKMYLNLYDTMQHLESPSKDVGVEAFLNQLAGGLSVIQGQYDSFLQDTYQMYASEYEIRRSKIEKVMEKENARAGYSLVLNHL